MSGTFSPTGQGFTSVTAPLVNSGLPTRPNLSISAATTSAAGSMSAADKTALDALVAGRSLVLGTETQITSNTNFALTTTYSDIMSITVTPPDATNALDICAYLSGWDWDTPPVGDIRILYQLYDSTASVEIGGALTGQSDGPNTISFFLPASAVPPSTASRTYKLRAATTVSTGTVRILGTATRPSRLYVRRTALY